LRRYWLPCLALLVLFIACRDSNFDDGRKIAKLFSGSYYKFYIAASVIIWLGLAIRRRKMQTIFWALELTLLCLIATNILKYSFHLARLLHMTHGAVTPGTNYSPGFPSAHTAFAFGLAWLMYVLKPRFSPLFFGMAIAVGWSRVELRAHYPYQVICGALLGMAIAYFICRSSNGIFTGLWKRWHYSTDKESSPNSAFANRLSNLISADRKLPTAAKQ